MGYTKADEDGPPSQVGGNRISWYSSTSKLPFLQRLVAYQLPERQGATGQIGRKVAEEWIAYYDHDTLTSYRQKNNIF
jgi:hypothetical protein